MVICENSRTSFFDGGLTIIQEFVRGAEGRITLTVENKGGFGDCIKIYLPQGAAVKDCRCENGFAILPLATGRTTLTYSIKACTERIKGRELRFLGDMLLTRKNGCGAYMPIINCFKLKGRSEEEELIQTI